MSPWGRLFFVFFSFPSYREVKVQGQQLGIQNSASCSRTLQPCSAEVLFFFWHLDCPSKKKTIQPQRHTLLYVTAMAFPERSPTLCSHWLHHIPSWNRLTLCSSHFGKLWMSFPREPAVSLYSGFKDSFCLMGPRIFFWTMLWGSGD